MPHPMMSSEDESEAQSHDVTGNSEMEDSERGMDGDDEEEDLASKDDDRSDAKLDDDDKEEEDENRSVAKTEFSPAESPDKAPPTPASTGTPTSVATAPTEDGGSTTKKKRKVPPGLGGSRKGRAPAVKGLTIPFRTVKKAMKLEPTVPIVQNEAAIMTTMASELFLKALAQESFANAKARGRNTIRYEDVAEARTKIPALSFLETLLP